MVQTYREREKLSLRKAAKIIGVDHTILHRFEHGKETCSRGLHKIILWVLGEQNNKPTKEKQHAKKQ